MDSRKTLPLHSPASDIKLRYLLSSNPNTLNSLFRLRFRTLVPSVAVQLAMVDPPGHHRAKRGLLGLFKKPPQANASLPVGLGSTGVLNTVDQPAVYHDRAKKRGPFSQKLLKKRNTQGESYKYQPCNDYDYYYDGWEGDGECTSWELANNLREPIVPEFVYAPPDEWEPLPPPLPPRPPPPESIVFDPPSPAGPIYPEPLTTPTAPLASPSSPFGVPLQNSAGIPSRRSTEPAYNKNVLSTTVSFVYPAAANW